MAGRHDEVISRYGALAQQVATEYGIDPRILLAQIIQEGNVKGAPGNNVMNLTAGSKWTGPIVNRGDTDAAGRKIKQNFRAYGSEEEGIRDYARMFATSDRYKGLRSGTTAERAAALGRSGYAEDPTYGAKITQLALSLPETFTPGQGQSAAPAAPTAPATTAQLAANIKDLERRLVEKYPELRVTSRDRDVGHNAAVGGAKNSQHTHGTAVDMSLRGMDEARQREVVEYARSLGARGLGYYPNSQSVHFDMRTGAPAAWGPNYSRTSLPQTPQWYQQVAAQHLSGASAPAAAAQTAAATPGAAQPLPNSPLPNVGAPDRGILADTPDPFKAIADAAEKRQAEQAAVLAASQAAVQQQPQAPPMAPPPPEQSQQQAINYAGLIMPRIRRGLLADDYSSGLLGAA